MKEAFFFSIDDQPVGPLDLGEIQRLIAAHTITRSTLAWREGMDDWRPIQAIPELLELVAQQERPTLGPPPLPGASTAQGKATPPPLCGAGVQDRSGTPPGDPASTPAQQQGERVSDDSGKPPGKTYAWLCRVLPRRSPLRSYLERNPGMSTPILVLAVFGLLLILAFLFDMQEEETASAEQPQQQPGAPSADWQTRYRIWQDTQRHNQGVLDDVYEYGRDADDRMSETYRRGTYDWYTDDKN